MLRRNFSMPDGRLIKLSLFSTVLGKSPLTSIYFTNFEMKRKVRSLLPRQSNILIFGVYHYIYNIHCTVYNLLKQALPLTVTYDYIMWNKYKIHYTIYIVEAV